MFLNDNEISGTVSSLVDVLSTCIISINVAFIELFLTMQSALFKSLNHFSKEILLPHKYTGRNDFQTLYTLMTQLAQSSH